MLNAFARSSDPALREIYKQVTDNDQFYNYVKGMVPQDVRRDLVREGNVFATTIHFSRTEFPDIERQFGYQPFRRGTKINRKKTVTSLKVQLIEFKCKTKLRRRLTILGNKAKSLKSPVSLAKICHI